jgi:membrane fusion protein, heavy metal efflux system
MIRNVCSLAASALVIAAMAAACSQPKAEQAPEAPKAPVRQDGVVRIQEAQKAFIETAEISAARTGTTVAAPARVDFADGAVSQVGAPLEGRVVSVHVLVGQRVKVGEPLLTLDCPEAATLRAAGAVARSSLREARLELERQKRMQQEGVGIERDVVAAETKVAAAEAEIARAESSAASIGDSTASSVVVRAPLGGVVISRKASMGMAVQRGGDPLIEIGNTASVRIVADVFERDLAHIREGARAQVTFSSDERPLSARVTSVSSVVTSGLRTAAVFLAAEPRGLTLRPGMYGRVAIDAADADVTLPVTAVLIKDGKDPIVYVQKDPLTFVRRRVVTAQPVEGRVQIVSGLVPGETVVVRGALLLDGSADQLL